MIEYMINQGFYKCLMKNKTDGNLIRIFYHPLTVRFRITKNLVIENMNCD